MHKEIDFENDIERALIRSGYVQGDPKTYDADVALFPAEILAFVQKTQPKFWTRLSNLDARQVHTKNGAIPDVVLAVNGLPVATLELKNVMSTTRWTVENAKNQYRYERDPKELLFAFKQRCLVHFAVDTESVFMTTKLEGKDTYFLPFNQGHNFGAGNPPAENDVRTSYLWHKVLSRDSLMDILARFIHLEVEEKTVVTDKGIKRLIKESMIFPRYHQLDNGDETDPQQLNTLSATLAKWQIYAQAEVNVWCEIWFRNRLNPTGAEHKKLNGLLDLAVERFKKLDEADQNLFKGQLASFRSLYGFISQIVPYQDSDHEKLYSYARFLLAKLPQVENQKVQLDDEVGLKYYRLQKISEGAIDLKIGEPSALYGPTEVGTGQADEEVQLSTLVSKLNERFGTEFTPADQLFFDQVRETAVANEQLRQAVMANSIENFEPVFNKQLENLIIERMDGNEEIFVRLMNDEAFKNIAASHLMRAVYQQVRAAGRAD